MHGMVAFSNNGMAVWGWLCQWHSPPSSFSSSPLTLPLFSFSPKALCLSKFPLFSHQGDKTNEQDRWADMVGHGQTWHALMYGMASLYLSLTRHGMGFSMPSLSAAPAWLHSGQAGRRLGMQAWRHPEKTYMHIYYYRTWEQEHGTGMGVEAWMRHIP